MPASAQDQVYRQPRLQDDRLDWCQWIGRVCGYGAALEFCRDRRFEEAAAYAPERVGRRARTRTIVSNETCSNNDGCTAFASITCRGPVEPERVFANPSLLHERPAQSYRLDNCLSWGAKCGAPAANEFCRAQGFPGVFHFKLDPEAGRSATQVISSGQICTGPACRGFQMIVCQKR